MKINHQTSEHYEILALTSEDGKQLTLSRALQLLEEHHQPGRRLAGIDAPGTATVYLVYEKT